MRESVRLCVCECNEIPHVSQFAKQELSLSLSPPSGSSVTVAAPVTVFVYSFDRLLPTLCLPFTLAHFAPFCSRCYFLVFSFTSLALVRILCRKRICVRWQPAVRFCKGDHSVYLLFLSMHIHSNVDPNHCVLMEMEKRIICNQMNEQTNKHKNHRKRNWVVWWCWCCCCFTYARAHAHYTCLRTLTMPTITHV